MGTNRQVNLAPFKSEDYRLFANYPIPTIEVDLNGLLQYVPEKSVHEMLIEVSGDLVSMAAIELDLLSPDDFRFLNSKCNSLYSVMNEINDVFKRYRRVSEFVDSAILTLKGLPTDEEQQDQALSETIDPEKPWLLFQEYQYDEYWFSRWKNTRDCLQIFLPKNSLHTVILQTGIELAAIANINFISVPAAKMRILAKRIDQLDDVVDYIKGAIIARASIARIIFKDSPSLSDDEVAF
jgi:hypothetical protein